MTPETRRGDELQVGTDTIRTPHLNTIVRKAPVKAEIAGEWIGPVGGRKLRSFYGSDADGSWRGRVVDVGHVNENSPYCYIKVLDDKQIEVSDLPEIAGEMSEGYLKALIADRRVYEDENYYQLLKAHLQRVLEIKRDERRRRRHGLRAMARTLGA